MRRSVRNVRQMRFDSDQEGSLKGVMSLVFDTLEPFAKALWRNEIWRFVSTAEGIGWRKKTYFGGLYQKVVACKADGASGQPHRPRTTQGGGRLTLRCATTTLSLIRRRRLRHALSVVQLRLLAPRCWPDRQARSDP